MDTYDKLVRMTAKSQQNKAKYFTEKYINPYLNEIVEGCIGAAKNGYMSVYWKCPVTISTKDSNINIPNHVCGLKTDAEIHKGKLTLHLAWSL